MRRTLSALLVAALAACDGGGREVHVGVRTTLPVGLIEAVEASFEDAHPAVDLIFTSARDEVSREELSTSGIDPFEVWWGASGVELQRASNAGLLEPYRPRWSDDDTTTDEWHPLLLTPFVIAFNADTLTLTRAPTDWLDLFHFRWRGEVHALDPVRTEEGAYLAASMILESVREYGDPLSGFDWLARLDDQVPQYSGSSSEAVRALGRGQGLIAILPRADVESARASDAPWVYYRMPETGTPQLVRGVALARGASDEARRFVDFLGSVDVMTTSRLLSHWDPAFGPVDTSRVPEGFALGGSWTGYPVAVDTLALELSGWVDRWDLEVRGR